MATGTKPTVLPGVVIGDGAVISATSLVNKDVPPYTIVGGVPVRVPGAVPELEGLFLLSFLKMDWPTVAVCALWFGLSDWIDYGPFETYPHFPNDRAVRTRGLASTTRAKG